MPHQGGTGDGANSGEPRAKVGDTMTQTIDDTEWFYNSRGTKQGPVTAADLRLLFKTRKIDPETHVWRKGLTDWIPIRDAALIEELTSAPPPLSGKLIGNGLVWTVAFMPLVFAVLNYFIVQSEITDAMSHTGINPGSPYFPAISGLPWYIPAAINGLLCLWDERRLSKAGYSSAWLTVGALFLVPIYLFVRASRLKQFPYYGIVWLVMMVVSLL